MALLAGCAQPAVQDMSNGQHSLTAIANSGGVAGSHEEAFEQASGYCARTGQQARIGAFYDKAEVGAGGEHTCTIIFSCAAARVLHF